MYPQSSTAYDYGRTPLPASTLLRGDPLAKAVGCPWGWTVDNSYIETIIKRHYNYPHARVVFGKPRENIIPYRMGPVSGAVAIRVVVVAGQINVTASINVDAVYRDEV